MIFYIWHFLHMRRGSIRQGISIHKRWECGLLKVLKWEYPLYSQIIGMRIGDSCRRLMPIILEETINVQRYRVNILKPFIIELHIDELQQGYFQENGATCYTICGWCRTIFWRSSGMLTLRTWIPPRIIRFDHPRWLRFSTCKEHHF